MEREKDGEFDLEENLKDSSVRRGDPRNVPGSPAVLALEVPPSVQDIINRIERAQASQAQEDINAQLNDIMTNMNGIMSRYTLGFDLPYGRSVPFTEHMKKQRTLFLEKMSSCAKNVEDREDTYLHSSLIRRMETLSAITETDVDEHYQWIQKMEMFPDTLRATKNNVNILSKISASFFEEKKKQKKKTCKLAF